MQAGYSKYNRIVNHTDLQDWWYTDEECPDNKFKSYCRSVQSHQSQMKGQFCGQDISIQNYTAGAASADGVTPDSGYKIM